jgi:hypothetical protein
MSIDDDTSVTLRKSNRQDKQRHFRAHAWQLLQLLLRAWYPSIMWMPLQCLRTAFDVTSLGPVKVERVKMLLQLFQRHVAHGIHAQTTARLFSCSIIQGIKRGAQPAHGCHRHIVTSLHTEQPRNKHKEVALRL